MELTRFITGCIFIFVLPQLLFTMLRRQDEISINVSGAFSFSLVYIWLVFLFDYSLELQGMNNTVFLLSGLIFLIILVFIFYFILRHLNRQTIVQYSQKNYSYIPIILLSLLTLLPLKHNIGLIFIEWDAIVSWNQWALDMFRGDWQPAGTAYPVAAPAMWSLFYQIQGTSEIWWTAKLLMFIFPGFLLFLLFTLYLEKRDSTYLLAIFFSLPLIWWDKSISGYMDVPVAILGIVTLTLIYASIDSNKGRQYLILAVVFSGISSIFKQAGLAFCFFTSLYIFTISKGIFSNKEKIILTIICFSFFLSFLVVFFGHNTNPLANLSYLYSLSSQDGVETVSQPWSVIALENAKLIESKFIYIQDGHRYIVDYVQAGYITIVMLLSSLLVFVMKLPKEKKKLSYLLFLFSMIGICVWTVSFSYDYRNGLWVKSFFILLASLLLGQKLNKLMAYLYDKSPLRKMNCATYESLNVNLPRFFNVKVLANSFLITVIISVVGITLYLDSKNVAMRKQVEQQIRIDNVDIATKLDDLLENTEECVLVYTNRLMLPYNFKLNKHRDRIIERAWFAQRFESHFHHTCKGGRYFVFGPWTKDTPNAGWEIVQSGEKSGLLKVVGREDWLIYFAQPNES
ncbi:hypothetical protein [Grimontia sp. NTOU-MAR1]|uniref:hypothetical protein n=1 Tax=Grimontia sp. NTOU-MAR1 TaxID=3111011 RepID=UPI002DBCF332|nr:hypothetical protein [Grimontia sp. NTOU-MAR1]WRV97518.1 hypothetical protein VP504_15990 [Grimontia sp. NTOU-MAR1]